MSNQPSQALTELEVAKQLGLSVATLRAWRLKGKGPRFVRFGCAVRYLADDVERFVKASVVELSGHVGNAKLVIENDDAHDLMEARPAVLDGHRRGRSAVSRAAPHD